MLLIHKGFVIVEKLISNVGKYYLFSLLVYKFYYSRLFCRSSEKDKGGKYQLINVSGQSLVCFNSNSWGAEVLYETYQG